MIHRATLGSLCLACMASIASAQATPGPIPPSLNAPRSGSDTGAPQSSAPGTISPSERELLEQLHAANVTEIAAGKLALKRARAKTVKRYAAEIVRDHEQAERDLARVAAQASVTLKTPPTDKVEALNNVSGPANFDHDFITMMARQHETAVRIDAVRA